MPTDTLTGAEFEVARFLASGPTPQEIIAFRLSPTSTDRFYALVAAEREGQLSGDEQRELDAFMNVEHMMRLIKAEAHKRLASQAS